MARAEAECVVRRRARAPLRSWSRRLAVLGPAPAPPSAAQDGGLCRDPSLSDGQPSPSLEKHPLFLLLQRSFLYFNCC